MTTTHKPRSGFTLVELLVTMAIVIVLAALAFTLSSKAMKAAKASKCVSNLRQIGSVIHEIREEGIDNGHNSAGFFPPYAGQISAPSPWRSFNIYELIGEKAGFCEFEGGSYRWSVHPSDTFLQNPLSEHELCGDTEKASQVTGKKFSSWGSYGYNTLIEGWVAQHTSSPKKTRFDDVPFPERTILMAEQNPKHGDVPIWFGPWGNSIPAGSYNDSVHCLFVDGHVQLLKNDYLASAEGKKKHIELSAGF